MRFLLPWHWCLAILAALVVASNLAHAAVAPRILVLGDSLSAAYGLPQEAGWVALLQSRLKARKFPYQVVNASISGETTAGGRTRLPSLLAHYRPQVVILALGANDGLRGLDLEQTRGNLEAMIRAAKASGARLLLVGMKLPPNYGPAYTQRFHALYGSLARQHQLAFVPFLLEGLATRQDWFQADGLHPTAEAQPHILDTVWPVLEPLLR
ncbi:arylesterase [Thiobacter aerophilum]|uniref:Arylesterase n=1 Tax=Thiobacter aerophilum TaxID=3121275 RepID=A0ABV0EEV5_9BURK